MTSKPSDDLLTRCRELLENRQMNDSSSPALCALADTFHPAIPPHVRLSMAELKTHREAMRTLLDNAQHWSGEVTGWQPIETAPVDTEVVVFWLDPESPEHPERYDFDMLDDGCWRVWTDHYEFAHSVAPAGSRMPLEQPPYTHWKPLGVPADTARAEGGES
ncbi:hypothetical protein [Burkholderia multivorans]|uniref:hypothetical protein n=1 Tax=Burkholderia multivorans TaxID=87883 RepID=UPI0021BF144F|nr:hypothetical protein [Burkholderia multivorans]